MGRDRYSGITPCRRSRDTQYGAAPATNSEITSSIAPGYWVYEIGSLSPPVSRIVTDMTSGTTNRMPISTHGMTFDLAGRPSPNTPRTVSTRRDRTTQPLSLIHISEPTRRTPISYAVFCLKKKKKNKKKTDEKAECWFR